MLSPASRQISRRRVASVTSLLPHALKNSVLPPTVPVPRLNTGTVSPPICRNSIPKITCLHPFDGSQGPPPRSSSARLQQRRCALGPDIAPPDSDGKISG